MAVSTISSMTRDNMVYFYTTQDIGQKYRRFTGCFCLFSPHGAALIDENAECDWWVSIGKPVLPECFTISCQRCSGILCRIKSSNLIPLWGTDFCSFCKNSIKFPLCSIRILTHFTHNQVISFDVAWLYIPWWLTAHVITPVFRKMRRFHLTEYFSCLLIKVTFMFLFYIGFCDILYDFLHCRVKFSFKRIRIFRKFFRPFLFFFRTFNRILIFIDRFRITFRSYRRHWHAFSRICHRIR